MTSTIGAARAQNRPADLPLGPKPNDAPAPYEPPSGWYNRASISLDVMVTIEDQTPDDFERYAPENAFCDYLDGVVYMPSPVSDRHQDVVFFLSQLLGPFRHRMGTGVVRLGPAVLRLGEYRKPEPDLFVLPPADAPPGAPPACFVLEMLSPSTRSHDLGRKLQVYRDAGIPEIWLIDHLGRDRSVIVERKVGDGYRRESFERGRLDSTALPPFWIEVDWLWSDPLPDPSACLDAILGPGPAG